MPIYAIARKAVPANGTGIKQRPLQEPGVICIAVKSAARFRPYLDPGLLQ